MTIKFRLYQYIDGNGDTIFRAARRLIWGIYLWETYGYENAYWEWRSRSAAIAYMFDTVERERSELINRGYEKRARKLKLVVVEDIDIEQKPISP